VKRKVLVLDLDETLIHSHHDGVMRQTVKPGTPPDFVLKVTIDRHPVRFFVHKRPHVDYFLDIVSPHDLYAVAMVVSLQNTKCIYNNIFHNQNI
jgi:TFIIF-interacting CTD phosphatase-like protein